MHLSTLVSVQSRDAGLTGRADIHQQATALAEAKRGEERVRESGRGRKSANMEEEGVKRKLKFTSLVDQRERYLIEGSGGEDNMHVPITHLGQSGVHRFAFTWLTLYTHVLLLDLVVKS